MCRRGHSWEKPLHGARHLMSNWFQRPSTPSGLENDCPLRALLNPGSSKNEQRHGRVLEEHSYYRPCSGFITRGDQHGRKEGESGFLAQPP